MNIIWLFATRRLDDTMGKTSTYVKNKQVQTSYKMTRIA